MSNPNVRQTSPSPLKFYAPVQIVTPTLYLNSSDKNQNNIVIQLHDENDKLHDENDKLQINPESKYNELISNYKTGKGINMKCQLLNGQNNFGYYSGEIERNKKFN